ncbi:hypothetical protein HYT18_01565 [Candidatus Microgenomates bacterium]|nr:hypothetical protein [Candidatus Microgenomates bacterium]
MSQEAEPGVQHHRLSRRTFLKGTVVTIGGVGAVLVEVNLGWIRSLLDKLPVPDVPPREKFNDLLEPEQLRINGIRIYQTSRVKLYLREGIFDFPLFKDAKEGKIVGVNIVLVDHTSLSWNASEKLSEEARLVWQAFSVHPQEEPEDYWRSKIKQAEDDVKSAQERIQSWQERMSKFTTGEYQKEVEESIADYQRWIQEITSPQLRGEYEESLRYWEEKLRKIKNGELKKEYEENIASNQSLADEGNKELAILRDQPRAIAHEAENGGPQGSFTRLDRYQKMKEEYKGKYPQLEQRHKELFVNYPELHNQVFIYIVVGGEFKPHPQQSYLEPGWFQEYPWIPQLRDVGREKAYHRYSEPFTAGTTLRHEAFHYESEGEKSAADEYDADTRVFESVVSAWEKYQQTGDTSSYPFVFVTREGITVTKKLVTSSMQGL